MNIIAVIPARYHSTRFPGKPLTQILNKPMIQWVYEAVLKAEAVSGVYVATDDERIYTTVMEFGGNAIMTGVCSCGTERVWEACKDIDFDVVLNIQGDEPTIKAVMIDDLIRAFEDSNVYMATLKKEMQSEHEIHDPNVVKLISDKNGDAIYFSRSIIPYNRNSIYPTPHYKHIGIYAYKKEFLATYVSLPVSFLESAEKLEQLRVIENGYKIRVVETKYQSIGVDIPEHIALVESELSNI
jgi:3-deoxy-manno-octulosonate cytidylyltransferase (CMP-KDO synthetase)